jgi:opacity protein-like surface antigen
MKMKHFMAASVLGIILLATQTQAQTDDTTNQPARRFTALLGYRYVPFDYSFAHDTHPDDSFLPGSGIRGSAGRTNLQNGHFGVVGVGYQARGKLRSI